VRSAGPVGLLAGRGLFLGLSPRWWVHSRSTAVVACGYGMDQSTPHRGDMVGEQARTEVPGDDDFAVVVGRLQQQINDLMSTVEAHQLLFERLRALGLLTDDGEADRR
jgi:hypothetical protein